MQASEKQSVIISAVRTQWADVPSAAAVIQSTREITEKEKSEVYLAVGTLSTSAAASNSLELRPAGNSH